MATGLSEALRVKGEAVLRGTMPVFQPGSPLASGITHLFVVTLWVCAAIFALVTCLIVYIIIRFRRHPGASEPPQVSGYRPLEVLWTLLPLLTLVWLFILTVQAMHVADPAPHGEPDVIITGHQWWWDVVYPGAGVVTANEIHIPVGRQLLLRLESADVIHDFWVPALTRKMDMVPGHPNHIWLAADQPGMYAGACAEFCGVQHAWMRVLVIAHVPAEFAAWLEQQRQPAPGAVTTAAQGGRHVFEQLTCVNCHTIAGTGASPRLAPDLTHLASRRTLGAGVLENTPPNLVRWLHNPQAIKPGSHMPQVLLSEAQVQDLTAYLETLR